MRRHFLAAVAAAVLSIAVSSESEAQSWKFDIGVNGGASFYTPALDGDEIGANNVDAVKYKAGWLSGAQLTIWPASRLGIRANGTYTDRPLIQDERELYGNVNLWSGSGDLLIRLKGVPERYEGMQVLPYLALGAGAKWTNPAQDLFSIQDPTENAQWNGVPFGCTGGACFGPGGVVPATGTTRGFFLSEERVLMFLGALGADFRMAPNFALRLEVGDRVHKPPIVSTNVAVGRLPTLSFASNSDDRVSKYMHEPYIQAGLHMLMGVASAPVVAITPTPAPPAPAPEPTPAPTPPPAPTTESVSVCVVDPTAPGGLRIITATRNITRGDTTVMQGGQNIPLAQAVGTVPVASNATWYIQGQPLTLGRRAQLKYVSFGSSRVVNAQDLAFLGTVNGMPVYADADEARDLMSDLNELTAAQRRGDLADIVDEQRDVRGELEDIKVLYTPLQATGCIFQPVQLQEQVRKVRG